LGTSNARPIRSSSSTLTGASIKTDTKGDPNGAAGDPVALRAQVSLQSSWSAIADALTVAGFLDRGRAATGGRSW
jgi:hypothetical protein